MTVSWVGQQAFGMALGATLLCANPVSAFVTAPCGPEFSPLTITEPWEESSRTFAEGAIRIFEIFIDPNVASGAALGILHPNAPGSDSYRTCTAIYAGDQFRYFAQAFVADATAVYDASVGLIITVPVAFADGNGPVMLRFAVNQATGVVRLL
ncbi:hypothetical protein [Jannaschia sp. CCS1]|uniref:hypothetical protein n=1 Tax=Jannaschia sp. (strain CCS1) TaxID=290400 RepID=UPI000053A3FC|nr:hypothetical protein [Jannaschia sp. CCS1]ABD53435.1 hypothetical protein Jann_0518 [Jannaschia sp. CCS1]